MSTEAAFDLEQGEVTLWSETRSDALNTPLAALSALQPVIGFGIIAYGYWFFGGGFDTFARVATFLVICAVVFVLIDRLYVAPRTRAAVTTAGLRVVGPGRRAFMRWADAPAVSIEQKGWRAALGLPARLNATAIGLDGRESLSVEIPAAALEQVRSALAKAGQTG